MSQINNNYEQYDLYVNPEDKDQPREKKTID